jgi:hypothetical protein
VFLFLLSHTRIHMFYNFKFILFHISNCILQFCTRLDRLHID